VASVPALLRPERVRAGVFWQGPGAAAAMTTIDAMVSPSRVQRTWDLQRAAPMRGTLSHVSIRTLSSPDGKVDIEVTPDLTVGSLKQRIALRLNIPPRKEQELTWWGTKLEDEKCLSHYKLTDLGSGPLELRLRSRVQAELEGLRNV